MPSNFIVSFLVLFLLASSPTLLILWSAIAAHGFAWSLLLIPVGALLGAIGMAVGAASWCALEFHRDDEKTGPPPAGSLGAGLGRGIASLIAMGVFGLIGSGVGAWVTRHWVVTQLLADRVQ
jgi:hypothetical protein